MLTFLIVVACIYFFFLFVGRYLFPWLLKYYLKRFQKNMFNQQPEETSSEPEHGSVHINFTPDKNEKYSSDNIGEYTDYEEIK